MAKINNVLEAIGKTPLIRLNRVAEGLKATVYVKSEFLNPGGSIKDRIGMAMIEAAERKGLLKPGGVIIEATAGNTGVGIALAAAIKGYRCIFAIPDKMSTDKINLLRAYGAEVIITPTSVPPDSPESYNGVAERLAREIPGAYHPNQFNNPYNPQAHYLSTGPEIWADTEGKIDILVASMGTGGTISGTSRYLKERNPNIIIVGADPEGSILSGDTPQSYKVEGIGEDFIPRTFDRQIVDEMVRISDEESFRIARRLAREEGLLVGGSTGTAVAAAIKYAMRLDEPKLMVVIAPDTGRNYINKIYSDAWLQENGFDDGVDDLSTLQDIINTKSMQTNLVSLTPRDTLEKAIDLMSKYNISQIPVVDGNSCVGSITESTLMKQLYDGLTFSRQEVAVVMAKPLPVLDVLTPLTEAYRILMGGQTGIVVKHDGQLQGFITRADIIKYLTLSGSDNGI